MSNSVRKLFVSSKIMHISVAEEYMELFIYFNHRRQGLALIIPYFIFYDLCPVPLSQLIPSVDVECPIL